MKPFLLVCLTLAWLLPLDQQFASSRHQEAVLSLATVLPAKTAAKAARLIQCGVLQVVATNMIAVQKASSTSPEYPPGKLGEVVRLGEQLVETTSTHPLTKPFVGNQLNCTSCHLDAGTHQDAASFIGVAAAYPAFAPRENKVITLEDRILNCFIRSQNGKRPPNGGEVSTAIAAYITWLSRGTPIAMNPTASLGPNHLTMLDDSHRKPDADRGRTLYENRCADCHASDGSGSDEGPPVWGEQSFNDGAGLSKIRKMASWLKVAMPLDDTDLTTEEAFDIAAYVNSHDRPRFKASVNE